MIDIHCHILPGVDDGSKNIEEAIQMAKIAEEDGIKTIINTSHYHPEFKYIEGDRLKEELVKFNNTLKENSINVEVILGNELYFDENLFSTIDKKGFFSLGGSRYILIEFSPTRFPSKLNDIIYELKLKGYVPILAHIERYGEIQANPKLVTEAIKEGALIQINGSSILGKSGKDIQRISELLLNNNLVHFVASDGHGSSRRRPMLKEAYNYLEENYSKEVAYRLIIDNPSKILADEEIATRYEEPHKEKTKKSIFFKLFNK